MIAANSHPDFIAIDVETANSDYSSICQVGIAVFKNGEMIDSIISYVNPETDFSSMNIKIHKITPDLVSNAPTFGIFIKKIRNLVDGQILVHHTAFDRVAIKKASAKYFEFPPDCYWLDSSMVARQVWSECSSKGYGLSDLAKKFNIPFEHHDALEDAKTAGYILLKALNESGIPLKKIAGVPSKPKPKSALAIEKDLADNYSEILLAHKNNPSFALNIESYVNIIGKRDDGFEKNILLVRENIQEGMELFFEPDKYDYYGLHAMIFSAKRKKLMVGHLARPLAGKLIDVYKNFSIYGNLQKIDPNIDIIPDSRIPIGLRILAKE